MRVWIAQCLCPDRHCILAVSGEAEGVADATTEILDPLRAQVSALVKTGAINPWCGICRAADVTWRYELGRTRFRTMEEARPELEASQREQAVTRAVMGGH